MSGNEDSKQIRIRKLRRRPPGRTTCSTRAPLPVIILSGAARLMRDSHPSADGNGMSSPNGTSLVLVYVSSIPLGPTIAATLDFTPVGLTASWLTSSRVLIEEDRRWSLC